MSPQPKKRAAAKPEPEQLPADLEPDEPDEPDNDDEPEPDDKPDKDHDQSRGNDPELKIVVKREVIEVDVPRDGNEVDTLNRVAQLVDEL